MARPAPALAELARPESAPPAVLLRVAVDGLRALGLYTHAEACAQYGHVRSDASRAVIEAAGRALLDVEAAYAAAGLDDWATLAARTARYLRLVAYGLRGAA